VWEEMKLEMALNKTTFVSLNSHRNVILMSVPHRYLDMNSCVNIEVIKVFNRKLEKQMKVFEILYCLYCSGSVDIKAPNWVLVCQ
jgi:hypothetical protein